MQTFLRTVARVVGSEAIDDVVAFFRAFEGMEVGFRDRAMAVEALPVVRNDYLPPAGGLEEHAAQTAVQASSTDEKSAAREEDPASVTPDNMGRVDRVSSVQATAVSCGN